MTTFILKTKTGATMTADIDLAALPPVSMERIVRLGITNILRDSYAGDKDDAARRASFDKALAAMLSGTAVERTRTTDPVAAKVKELAKDTVKAALRAKGAKVDADKFKELVTAYIAKNGDALRAKAEAAIAEAAKQADGIDLDDLGL